MARKEPYSYEAQKRRYTAIITRRKGIDKMPILKSTHKSERLLCWLVATSMLVRSESASELTRCQYCSSYEWISGQYLVTLYFPKITFPHLS
jgi:hypothetical protein